MARLGTQLNLTDAQKAQAADIFQAARQQSQPLAQQLRQYRVELAAAVKSGAPAEQIDAVTAKMGPLMSQLTGIQTKAFQKFYAALTPDQQQKIGEHLDRFLGGGMMGFRPASARRSGSRSWHGTQQ